MSLHFYPRVGYAKQWGNSLPTKVNGETINTLLIKNVYSNKIAMLLFSYFFPFFVQDLLYPSVVVGFIRSFFIQNCKIVRL